MRIYDRVTLSVDYLCPREWAFSALVADDLRARQSSASTHLGGYFGVGDTISKAIV